jgi:hypothetical protein
MELWEVTRLATRGLSGGRADRLGAGLIMAMIAVVACIGTYGYVSGVVTSISSLSAVSDQVARGPRGGGVD